MCTKVLPRPHLTSTAHSKPNARSQTKPRPASLAPPTPRRKTKVARSNGTVDTPRQSCLSMVMVTPGRLQGDSVRGPANGMRVGGQPAGRRGAVTFALHTSSRRAQHAMCWVCLRAGNGTARDAEKQPIERTCRGEPVTSHRRAHHARKRGVRAGQAAQTLHFFCKFLGLCLVNGWTSYAKDN